MKKNINKLINQGIEGVDTYHHNGSIWLIFTETKQWVIELTENGTLWYNYYFFNNLFNYLSLNVIRNQDYITKWVEGVLRNGVRGVSNKHGVYYLTIEDTIQNGVRVAVPSAGGHSQQPVDVIIQNGDLMWKK